MFSITSLSDEKVKSFTESNCQLLFIVFSYVSIFLFVPSVEFLCSVQILALFDNKQGTDILTQGMQTHLISNCLCVTHLRSISALLERVAGSLPSWWPVPEFLLPEFRYMLLDNFILHFIWQSMTLVIIQRLQPLHLFFSFFFLYGL